MGGGGGGGGEEGWSSVGGDRVSPKEIKSQQEPSRNYQKTT